MPIEQKAYDSTIMGGLPYYDDFNQSKKFLKMLFKPGLPVQARELSQAQTFLQNQIERLGSHIFKNGSVVLGGGVSTSSANFIRLQTDLPLETLKRMINQKIRVEKSDGSLVDAIVAGYADKSTLVNDAYQILFLKYITVGEFSDGDVFFTIGVGNIGVENTVLNTESTPGSGFVQTFATVEQGIFYIDGYFCLADAQSVAATKNDSNLGYRTFTSTNSSLGFNAVKSVVSSDLDTTLRDPSFGFNNFNAPGADRYKIDPVLESRSLTGVANDSNSYVIDDPTNFFELVRVIDGKVTKKIKYPDLAQLEKTLARRTFDESGNYTVQPFEIEVGSHDEIFGTVDTSKFGVKLSPGKAYVSGFEFETIAPTLLTINKGSDALTGTRNYSLNQGSYFQLFAEKKPTDFDGDTTSPQIDGATLDGFIDNSTSLFINGSPCDLEKDDGTVIGSCVPTHFLFGNQSTSAPVRLYFHSKTLTTGFTDTDIKKIVRRNASDNSEVFSLNVNFTSDGLDSVIASTSTRLADISSSGSVNEIRNPVRLTLMKPFRGTTDASGVVGFTSGIGSKDFLATVGEDTEKAGIQPVAIVNFPNTTSPSTDNTECVLVEPTLIPSIDNSVSSVQLDFGTNLANRQVTCFLPMTFESKNNIRKKTTSGNQTATVNKNTGTETPLQSGSNKLSLGVPDVKEIISITENDTNTDITSKFKLDKGITDSTYENSSIVLIDPSDPDITRESEISVTFTRYIHSGDGPFTKDSYLNVPVDELPVSNKGLSAVDLLDFRSIVDSEGNYNQGTGEPSIVPFDSSAVPSFVTVSTFLPRIDSVVLTSDRKIIVVEGTPDEEPTPPRISSGDLELYRIRVNGASSEAQTLQVQYVDNQRFTMSEINTLEERTTEDFIENYRKDLRNNMVGRGNAAFLDATVNEDDVYIDDLFGHENVDSVDPKCNVSFDPTSNSLRPAFKTAVAKEFSFGSEIGLSGVTISNDGIALVNFDVPAAPHISQPFSNSPTASVDINPFGINDYLGTIKLTPHRAKYWSESRKARIVTNVRGELNTYETDDVSYDGEGRRRGFGTIWRDWEIFWCGVEERDRNTNQNLSANRIYKAPKRSATIKRILSEKTKKTVSGRVIDLSIRPYLDTFTLSGVVEGVLPGATYNLFFDGVQQNSSNQPYQASTGITSGGGTFEFTTVIPADTYTTGKKLVRVISGADDDNVVNCDSSADAIFYGEGRPDTTLFGDTLVRPPVIRRKAARVNETSDEYFSDIFEQSNAQLVNALNPVSQTINIDAELYPNGLFMNEVRLWFLDKDKDVTLRIHPTRAGNPLTSIVMPFSEVIEITKAAEFESSGLLRQYTDESATVFTFSTPVFLPAGEYSISVSTNDTDTRIVTYDENSGATPIKPASMLKVYLPQNDGSVVGYEDQYFAMKTTHCSFNTAVNNNFDMQITDVAAGTPVDSVFINANPPTNSSDPVTCTFNFGNGGSLLTLQPTTTISARGLGGRQVIGDQGNGPNVNFSMRSPEGIVSSVIDTESVAVFLPSIDINDNSDMSSELINDEGSDNHFRYYSKVIQSNIFLGGLVASIDGSFAGLDDLRVFARTATDDQDIFAQPFREVFLGGPDEEGDGAAQIFDEVSGASSLTYFRRFDARGSDLFTSYQVKVVGIRDEGDVDIEAQIPIIDYIGVAPVRTATSIIASQGTPGSGAVDGGSVPTGTVFAVLGDVSEYTQPVNGVSEYLSMVGNDESRRHSKNTYSALFSRISDIVPAQDSTTFTLPDMRGRTLVTAGEGTNLTSRTLGDSIGSEAAPGGQNFTITANTVNGEITPQGDSSNPLSFMVRNDSASENGNIVGSDKVITDVTASSTSNTDNTNLQPSYVVNYIIKT